MSTTPRPAVEFATTTWCQPLQGAATAARSEELGFDIQGYGFNECMTSDTFAELRLAAAATERIRLMPGIANFVTRHPVVVAGACAALQLASGGRATCGVGKGDSAVAMVGRSPQRHDDYVAAARQARAYLRGEAVEVGGVESRLQWLPEGYEPVELEMFASGPRSIRAAAAIADRITFAVGANPDRIRWALALVDEVLAAEGRTRADVRIGATIPYAVHEDPAEAERLLRPFVLGWAHMSSFPGMDLSEQPEIMRRVTEATREGYGYEYHTNATAPANPLTASVDDGFVRWFGVAGDPAAVADHLLGLWDLGIQHFWVASDGDQRERWALEVAPLVRAGVAERPAPA